MPAPEPEEDGDANTEEPQDTSKMTLLEAVEALGQQIRGICQRTKLSETTVLQLFSFQWSQIEQERQRQTMQGQAAVDAIAAEQAEQEEPAEPRNPDEVISTDE